MRCKLIYHENRLDGLGLFGIEADNYSRVYRKKHKKEKKKHTKDKHHKRRGSRSSSSSSSSSD